MGRWTDKYVIGLTGNIATGKSLVRRMLEHLGAYTLDADGLTHRMMEPQAPAYKPIVETFGKFVLNAEGQIDRQRLGAIAFSHPDALKMLEAITHPQIRQALDMLIQRTRHKIVVVEAIKLIETGLADQVDAVWVVNAAPELQLRRLMEKRKLSHAEAQKRIQIQNPQANKLARADVVIENQAAPETAWNQVQAAWKQIAIGAEESKAVDVVQTVQVPPQPAPAPAAPAQEASTKPPANAQQTLTSVDIKRPHPSDFENIANLINQETGSHLTKSDIMAKFGEKTFMLAEANDVTVGIIGFLVENLVTRVDEFVISANVSMPGIGQALIQAMEQASDELTSEVAFIFLAASETEKKAIFEQQGYEELNMEEVRYPAWREAVNEAYQENQVLLSKRLRENLVLKPI